MPHKPNPPDKSKSPSFNPYKAYFGVLQNLAKLKNVLLSKFPNINFVFNYRIFQPIDLNIEVCVI
jgi:hypothetical protein